MKKYGLPPLENPAGQLKLRLSPTHKKSLNDLLLEPLRSPKDVPTPSSVSSRGGLSFGFHSPKKLKGLHSPKKLQRNLSVESNTRQPDVLDFTNAIQEENLNRKKNALRLELIGSPTKSVRHGSVLGESPTARGQASIGKGQSSTKRGQNSVVSNASNQSLGSEYSRLSNAHKRRHYLTKHIKISSLKRNLNLVDLGMQHYEVHRFRRHERA